jgi:hypothetical protein
MRPGRGSPRLAAQQIQPFQMKPGVLFLRSEGPGKEGRHMSTHRATGHDEKRSRPKIRGSRLTAAGATVLAAAAIAAAGGGGGSSAGQSSVAPSQAAAPSHDAGIPQNNGGDHDADNNGGPSDGDGQI